MCVADHPQFFLFFPVRNLSELHFAFLSNVNLDQASEHFCFLYRSQVNQTHRPYLQHTC